MLQLSPEDVREILENSITSARDAFAAMKIRIDDLRLRAQTKTALEALDDALDDAPADGLSKDDVLERLTAEARTMSESGAGLNSVILAVLEALFRGGGFARVLFAFVNAEGTRMQARAGLGDDIESLISRFSFPLSLRGGPVVPALLRKTDTVVSARNEPENDLLQAFGVKWLAIYPVVVDSRVVGCLYLESAQPRADLSTGQLVLMEQLRNILVSAIQRVRRGLS
jgi:GAF domain-containing protein